MGKLSDLLVSKLPLGNLQTVNILSSQTWTVPSDIRVADDDAYYVWITMCGGGGSGGVVANTSISSAIGGAGGDFCVRYKIELNTGTGEEIVVTIGNGGDGVTAQNLGYLSSKLGNAGGASSFGSYLSVSGGDGGYGGGSSGTEGAGRVDPYGGTVADVGSPGGVVNLSGNIFSDNLIANGCSSAGTGSERAGYGGHNAIVNTNNGVSWSSGAIRSTGGGAGLFGSGTSSSTTASGSASANSGAGSGGAMDSYFNRTPSSGNGGSGKCVIEYYN